jgi:hypothetical protein
MIGTILYYPRTVRYYALDVPYMRMCVSYHGLDCSMPDKFIKLHKIQVTSAPPHRQSQNGLVERQWRTAVAMARAMLIEARLPRRYWFWALRESVIRMNLLPCKPTGPNELLPTPDPSEKGTTPNPPSTIPTPPSSGIPTVPSGIPTPPFTRHSEPSFGPSDTAFIGPPSNTLPTLGSHRDCPTSFHGDPQTQLSPGFRPFGLRRVRTSLRRSHDTF